MVDRPSPPSEIPEAIRKRYTLEPGKINEIALLSCPGNNYPGSLPSFEIKTFGKDGAPHELEQDPNTDELKKLYLGSLHAPSKLPTEESCALFLEEFQRLVQEATEDQRLERDFPDHKEKERVAFGVLAPHGERLRTCGAALCDMVAEARDPLAAREPEEKFINNIFLSGCALSAIAKIPLAAIRFGLSADPLRKGQETPNVVREMVAELAKIVGREFLERSLAQGESSGEKIKASITFLRMFVQEIKGGLPVRMDEKETTILSFFDHVFNEISVYIGAAEAAEEIFISPAEGSHSQDFWERECSRSLCIIKAQQDRVLLNTHINIELRPDEKGIAQRENNNNIFLFIDPPVGIFKDDIMARGRIIPKNIYRKAKAVGISRGQMSPHSSVTDFSEDSMTIMTIPGTLIFMVGKEDGHLYLTSSSLITKKSIEEMVGSQYYAVLRAYVLFHIARYRMAHYRFQDNPDTELFFRDPEILEDLETDEEGDKTSPTGPYRPRTLEPETKRNPNPEPRGFFPRAAHTKLLPHTHKPS